VESWSSLEIARAVALAIELAACAGLRAWLPLLLAGLLARFEILSLGVSWRFLASTEALILFGSATVVEILGDKIPAVDHVLDGVSSVVRPAAGSVLAASVLGFVHDPLMALVLGIAIGAPSALVPHVAKSGVRALSTGLTAGVANPVLSVIEDVTSVALFVLAVLVPLAVVVLLATAAFFVLRRILRRRVGAPRPA
jgi:hypothetical protein